MTNPQDAYEIIRTLGSLASMASAYIAIRRERRDIGERERKQILEAGEKGKDRIHVEGALRLLTVIPKGILDAANHRIRQVEKRYEQIIRSPNTKPAELDNEYEKAREEICALLKLIKRHNSGELPNEDFYDIWVTYQCDSQ